MDKKEINFVLLCVNILDNKKVFIKNSIIAIVVGVIIAFSIPNEYTTDVVLAPETSSSSGLSNNMSSLASMVGVKIGGSGSDDALYPEIYPEIFASNNFILPLFNIKVQTVDKRVSTTLYDYLKKYQKTAWWNKWRVVFVIIKSWFSNASKSPNVAINPFYLTQEQSDIANGIKGMIKCNVDKKTDMITISVTAQDALVSAIVADSVQKHLQNYIIKYRTNKARNDLEYMKKLYAESKSQYDKARQTYGAYADANTDLVLESFKSKQNDLENEMQLQYNIYTQMAQQLQMAKAKVQERTPAFTVVQSPCVPLKKTKPKRMVIVFGIFAMTFFVNVIWMMNKKNKKSEE